MLDKDTADWLRRHKVGVIEPTPVRALFENDFESFKNWSLERGDDFQVATLQGLKKLPELTESEQLAWIKFYWDSDLRPLLRSELDAFIAALGEE